MSYKSFYMSIHASHSRTENTFMRHSTLNSTIQISLHENTRNWKYEINLQKQIHW